MAKITEKLRLFDRTIKKEEIENCNDLDLLLKYQASINMNKQVLNSYKRLVNIRIGHLQEQHSIKKKNYIEIMQRQEKELSFWKNIVRDLAPEKIESYYKLVNESRED